MNHSRFDVIEAREFNSPPGLAHDEQAVRSLIAEINRSLRDLFNREILPVRLIFKSSKRKIRQGFEHEKNTQIRLSGRRRLPAGSTRIRCSGQYSG
ncbi:MAG: hypothetical protein WAR41_12620, partial [Azonexus sp.]